MKRICPACLTRRARLVDDACPVCDGAGVLSLGAAALTLSDPDVVSRAVSTVLEAVARRAEEDIDSAPVRVQAVRGAVALLVDAGLLEGSSSRRPSTRAGGARPTSPAALAASVSPVAVLPVDWILPEAPSYLYGLRDRPGARGLPVLSDDGHPSHLSRILDPAEPGASTARAAADRIRAETRAGHLASAAAQTVQIKRKKRGEQ